MATESLFNLFFPAIRLPASGNLELLYNPYTKWEAPTLIRGDERVEQRVYSEVASGGRQLGKITDVVLQLAKKTELASEEVEALKGIAADIATIKAEVEDRTEKEARVLLDRLAEKDASRLRNLLADYEAKATKREG
jgi:hypothetical protein